MLSAPLNNCIRRQLNVCLRNKTANPVSRNACKTNFPQIIVLKAPIRRMYWFVATEERSYLSGVEIELVRDYQAAAIDQTHYATAS